MRMPSVGSLERQLILRLAGVNLLALGTGFAWLIVKSYRIAHGLNHDGLADLFAAEFLEEAGWTFPFFVIGMIALVVFTVRSSLSSVAAASRQAVAIAPGQTDVRLEDEGLPTEIKPFVLAVNGALDRLAHGFEAQRRFTADAAHELRTPLAILTAGLEALPDTREVVALRADAARMGRLVDQLLRVARLDAMPAPALDKLDLNELAADLVARMAPWVHGEGCMLAFESTGAPVMIEGNADMLEGALRNLIENAVGHSPTGSEVTVRVGRDAEIAVIDHGPGVPLEQRDRLFDRFWRAPDAMGNGAGLGLAIVAAVVSVHGGTAEVVDTPGGGATFGLRLG
ncbi:sensor histidine kinase [Novosphingobium rosa]|uniref:sensor histidine kinase n=1 Tax=Novosphingobium rosa TaxID=76978 RepID=UPI0009FC3445|nr:HAMP domain-containing sensor histidine kinase [Novosphingobium rosa]